jgi:hypothetical protein
MAADQFDENDDTVFNIGADTGLEEEAFLFWNITSLEYPDTDFAGLYEACALEGESFTYDFDGEVLQLDGYTDDGTCGPFQGGDVTADGHPLNHGAYMSFFNSLYDGTGRGCLNRHLAQTDLGKETDGAPGTIEPDDQIDFQTVAADCQHGKNAVEGATDGLSVGQGHGHNWTHGKSGDAPGHNK